MSFATPRTDPGHADRNPGKVFIIVPRLQAYLADLLAKAFEERKGVEIIVDRRYGERRTQKLPTGVERRSGQRRRPKEEVIEVVFRWIGQPDGPREGPG